MPVGPRASDPWSVPHATTTTATTLGALLDRARALLEGPGRAVLGITGPPGAGKSTLAAALVDGLGPGAALLPMDGYHLSNTVLDALGRRDRKGAPDTFDAAGYAALLARLRSPEEAGGTVYAPCFHREFEESVAAELAFGPAIRLVVTEGNYLLLPDGPWAAVRPLLDACWYVDLEEDERLRRLTARHHAYGKTPREARAWAHGSDQANAALVARTRDSADLWVRLDS